MIELVFTDVLLPGGASGLDLAREVARRHPDLPIVLTTGYEGEVISDLATTNLPLLREPYDPDELRAVIEAGLSDGRYRTNGS